MYIYILYIYVDYNHVYVYILIIDSTITMNQPVIVVWCFRMLQLGPFLTARGCQLPLCSPAIQQRRQALLGPRTYHNLSIQEPCGG